MKYYIFGDTGGHMKQLFISLKELGVDPTAGTIPDDVTIIHLGDVIHKGPHSDLLIERINQLIRNNPHQWIQILGNHEFQHIKGAPYFWDCNCTHETIDTINSWYDEGLAYPTYALSSYTCILAGNKVVKESDATGVFFSHAGATWDWWEALEKPVNPVDFVNRLNVVPVRHITTPGQMLGVHGRKPGPVWAIGNEEVFHSWADETDVMPFTQVHGHTTSFDWTWTKWWRHDKRFLKFRKVTKLYEASRAVVTQMAGNLLIGIDPGYAENATSEKQPYLVIER